MKKTIALLWFILAGANLLIAQDEWGEARELEDANVIIEKDMVIELPKANRKFEQAPPLPVKTSDNQSMSYDFQDYMMNLSPPNPQIRVYTIKEDPLDKLYGNYLKLGLGNYLTSYGEFFSNNKRNEKYSMGLHARHLTSLHGPVDGRNSGTSNNELAWFGKIFASPATLSGGIKYFRDAYHFYGYRPGTEIKRDTLKQVFNGGILNLGLRDNFVDSDISIKLDMDFRYIRDKFTATEQQFNANFLLGFQLSDELSAGIQSDLLLSQYANAGALNRNLYRIKPSFSYKIDDILSVSAGFNVVYENDTTHNNENMRFYPFAEAAYNLTDDIQAYGKIGGDIMANTYYGMVQENPYLEQNAGILHTNKIIELAGGIKGSFFNNLAFDGGFSLGNYKNMYFFVNDPADTAKFAIIYDRGNVSLLNLYGELSLNTTETFRLSLRGDYYGYDVGPAVGEAWHKPKYKLGLSGYYNIYDKIALTSDWHIMGGMKGLIGDRTIRLDKIADINLKIDYLFSERFAAFLSFNNILSKNYELYLNYPTQGLLVLGGISYSF